MCIHTTPYKSAECRRSERWGCALYCNFAAHIGSKMHNHHYRGVYAAWAFHNDNAGLCKQYSAICSTSLRPAAINTYTCATARGLPGGSSLVNKQTERRAIYLCPVSLHTHASDLSYALYKVSAVTTSAAASSALLASRVLPAFLRRRSFQPSHAM